MASGKYGNQKVTIDGIKFDSRLEGRFYEYLKELKAAKQIKDFEIQKRFLLLEQFEKDGELFRKIEYIADFVVHHHDGMIEVFDTKGVETDVFKLKRKLFEHRYKDLKLQAITYSKIDGGWVSLDKVKKARKERKKAKLATK